VVKAPLINFLRVKVLFFFMTDSRETYARVSIL
jgi:hypothetical protein